MKIFMTGVTGFIGSNIAVELLKLGHTVVGLARNKNKVPGISALSGLEIVQGKLSDRDLLRESVAGKDVCIHVALDYTKKRGWEVLLDDTFPAAFLADAAAEAGVDHFIYTSSTSVNDSLYEAGIGSQDVFTDIVDERTKQRPATFYGATKSAGENFLMAQSYQSAMRLTIIRPGYTFGNPAVAGASMQADGRFAAIAAAAHEGRPITVIKNDGTQFIWAGDLAKLFVKALSGSGNRNTYFGLSRQFVSWEAIAMEAIEQCNSASDIVIEDRGWAKNAVVWDVSAISRDFGLEFDPWERIREHIAYLIEQLE